MELKSSILKINWPTIWISYCSVTKTFARQLKEWHESWQKEAAVVQGYIFFFPSTFIQNYWIFINVIDEATREDTRAAHPVTRVAHPFPEEMPRCENGPRGWESRESLSSRVIRRIKGVRWSTMGSSSKPRLAFSGSITSLPLRGRKSRTRMDFSEAPPKTFHHTFVSKRKFSAETNCKTAFCKWYIETRKYLC